MRHKLTINSALVCIPLFALWIGVLAPVTAQEEPPVVRTKTIVIGIPGAGAVARVGEFLAGPLKGAFATSPGRILDPNRVLVASTSNFGSPLWILDPGAILSIDPRAGNQPLVIPEKFAVGGGQVSILNGAIMLYTANNAAFVNAIQNPLASTQILPAVSVPTGIAIDNSYGRPAISSGVGIRDGEGWQAILDANGQPLKGPYALAGGVFAGDRTNRANSFAVGLVGGSFGTAFLGLSVDGSGREVFAVTNGDGSAAQVHLEKGADGLIFKGKIEAYSGSIQAQQSWGPGGVMNTRGGMLFQAAPERLLFICNPSDEQILVYPLSDNGTIFRAATVPRRVLQGAGISSPVDIAPAALPTTGPISNTTLAPGSDLYVANRGNGSITRLQQDGTVVAVRRLQVDGLGVIGPGRVNGIGLSNDGKSLYVTLTGPIDLGDRVLHGLLVSIPAF